MHIINKYQSVFSVFMTITFTVMAIASWINGESIVHFVGNVLMALGNLIGFICDRFSKKKKTASYLLIFARVASLTLLIVGFALLVANLFIRTAT